MVTYPLDGPKYGAADASLFHCTRTSGIHYKEDFPISVTGLDNNFTLGTGVGWMRTSQFSGQAFAMKEPVTADAGLPDPLLPRVDVVAVRFTAAGNETLAVIKKGKPSSAPVMPAISQTASVYELYLYAIRRDPGDVAITADKITDLRLNAEVCGLMADDVTHIDTDGIDRQATALIDKLSAEIKGVQDGSAYMMAKTYDPTGQKKDVFAAVSEEKERAQNAEQELNRTKLAASAANGLIKRVSFSGGTLVLSTVQGG